MVKVTESTEVYENDDGIPVVQDPDHPKLWRRVQEDGRTAINFAKAPPPGAKPIRRPEPIELQIAADQPAIAEQVADEVERLQRVIVEKDTVIGDKGKELLDKDLVIESRDKTIRDLHQQLETEKNTPRADPGEIDTLKREIARLTTEYNDAVKAAQEETAKKEKAAAEKVAGLEKQVSDLTKERDNLKAGKPAAASGGWWAYAKKHPYIGWGTSAGVLLVLLSVLIFARISWNKTGTQAQAATVPADYGQLKADVARLTAERDEQKARWQKMIKNWPPTVPLN